MRLKFGRPAKVRSVINSFRLAFIVLVVGVGVAAASCGLDSPGPAMVVFDCYLSLPSDYIVDTREIEKATFFRRSNWAFPRINVSKFRKTVDSKLVLVSSRTAGNLTVEEYQYDADSDFVDSIRFVRIHDTVQEVMIGGATDVLVSGMLASCDSEKW